MKKFSLLLVFMMVCICSNAYDVEINGIYYDLIKGKYAKVNYDYNNRYKGDIIIPSTITYENVNYTVICIAKDAFSYCKGLKSVTLPETLTTIEEWAFNSSTLKEIVIPNSVTTIENQAFNMCDSLESICLSDNLTKIEQSTFFCCKKLKSISLPDKITEIGNRAFEGCKALETVHLPANLLLLGQQVFRDCSSLEEIKLPESLLTIGARAFWQCKLKTIVIPDNVVGVGVEAFKYSENLSKVYIGKNVLLVCDKAFSNCKNLSDVYCYTNSVPNISDDGKWDESMWDGVFEKSDIQYATLHVPNSLINQYKQTPYWKEFGSIIALTDDDIPPSGIKEITHEDEKRIIYDLQGRRVDIPQKGIYIVNGKKVLIK